MYYRQLRVIHHHKGRSIYSYNNITSNHRLRSISLSSAIVDSFSTTTTTSTSTSTSTSTRSSTATSTGCRTSIPGTSTSTSSRCVLLVPESKQQQQQQQQQQQRNQSVVPIRRYYHQEKDDKITPSSSSSSLLLLQDPHSSLYPIQPLSFKFPSSNLYYGNQSSLCYANRIGQNHQWWYLSGSGTGTGTSRSTTGTSTVPNVHSTPQMYYFSQNASKNDDTDIGVDPSSIANDTDTTRTTANNANTTIDHEYYIIQKSYDILDQSLIPTGVMTEHQFQEEMYNIVLFWCNRVQSSIQKLKVALSAATTGSNTSSTPIINYNDELYTDTLVSFNLLMSLLNRIKLELNECERQQRLLKNVNTSDSRMKLYKGTTMCNYWSLSTNNNKNTTTNFNFNFNDTTTSTNNTNTKFHTVLNTIVQQWVSLYEISFIILPTLSKDNTIFQYKQLSIQTPNEMYEYIKRISDTTIITKVTKSTTTATTSSESSQLSSTQGQSIRINRDIILLLLRAVIHIDRQLLSQTPQLQENTVHYTDDTVPVFVKNVLIDTMNTLTMRDIIYTNDNQIYEIYSLVLHSWIYCNHIDRTEQIVSLFSKIIVSNQKLQHPLPVDRELPHNKYTQKEEKYKQLQLLQRYSIKQDVRKSTNAILNDCLHQLLTKPTTTTTTKIPTTYTITDNFDTNIKIAVQLFELVFNIYPGAITNETIDIILWAMLQKGSYETFLSSPAATATPSTVFSSSVPAPKTKSFLSPYLTNNNNNRNTLSTASEKRVRSRLSSLVDDEIDFGVNLVQKRILPDNMIVPYLQNIYQMNLRAFEFMKVVGAKLKENPNYDTNSMGVSNTFTAEMDARVIRLLILNLADPYRFVMKQNLSSTDDNCIVGTRSNTDTENNYTISSDLIVNDISTKQLNSLDLTKEDEIKQQLRNLSCIVFDFFLDLHKHTNAPQHLPGSRVAAIMHKLYKQSGDNNANKYYDMLPLFSEEMSARLSCHRTALFSYIKRFDEIIKLSTSTSSLSMFGFNQEGYNYFVSNIDEVSTILERIHEISFKTGVLERPLEVLRPVLVKLFLYCRSIPVTATYTVSNDNAVVDLLFSKENDRRAIHPSVIVLYTLLDNLTEKSFESNTRIETTIRSIIYLPFTRGKRKPTHREYAIFVLLWSKYKQYRKCWRILSKDVLELEHANYLNQLHSSILGDSSTMASNPSNETIDSIPVFYDTFIDCVVLNSDDVTESAMQLFTLITKKDIYNFSETNETSTSNPLQFQKRTRYVIIAILRLLLESNDISSKVLYSTLTIYKTISSRMSHQPKQNQKQVVVQQQNNPNDNNNDEDSNRTDIEQMYELLHHLICKHKSNTMHAGNKKDYDMVLQKISEEKRILLHLHR